MIWKYAEIAENESHNHDLHCSSPRPATRPQYTFRRERSLEDLNKDIATIWRELQEIDKITQPGAAEDRCYCIVAFTCFSVT